MNGVRLAASKFVILVAGSALVTGMMVAGPVDCYAAKKDKQAKEQTASAKMVDINSADEKTVAALPGIGKKTAKEIIAGRPYKSLDDLKRIKGLTESRGRE